MIAVCVSYRLVNHFCILVGCALPATHESNQSRAAELEKSTIAILAYHRSRHEIISSQNAGSKGVTLK